jgi:hypothetical protein
MSPKTNIEKRFNLKSFLFGQGLGRMVILLTLFLILALNPVIVVPPAFADEHGIQLEFINPGKPTQNSYVERFNRTYRTEVLDMYAFRRLSEVREITNNWIREYNEERPHYSLGDLTPREYLMANSNRENSKSQWT